LSVVIPCFNERENLADLHTRLLKALTGLNRPFELLFVDDGSTDGTQDVLAGLAADDERTKVLVFGRNFGQTAALMAGFDAARGGILAAIDADGQNDPADLAAMLDKLDEGYDVVSGWRRKRRDPLLRSLVSRIANRIISAVSGVRLRDFGCTLKVYRHEVLQDVRLYGEMHRFIPIYASWQGARVTELPVSHEPRRFGRSHYGFGRTIKVLLDLIVILFMDRYALKPFYVFGSFGLINVLASFVSGLVAVYLRLFKGTSFILTPLPLLTVLLFIVGVMSLLMGLLAEMIMRTYYESQKKTSYVIRRTINI
jgi:dolichol-phosphate mannosyltransferase